MGGNLTNASRLHFAAPAPNHPPQPQDASTTVKIEATTLNTSFTALTILQVPHKATHKILMSKTKSYQLKKNKHETTMM